MNNHIKKIITALNYTVLGFIAFSSLCGTALAATEMNTAAPDFTLKSQSGKNLKLSEYAGNVMLLNFWASFDQASRKSNALLQTIYDRYHAKGFEVYSVSLDNRKAAWLDAIRFEEYKWIDVCELTYPNSYAASIYNIESIPTSFLIDREGNIVAKNLNGKVLSTWLDNLL